jgi:hypothetical protein
MSSNERLNASWSTSNVYRLVSFADGLRSQQIQEDGCGGDGEQHPIVYVQRSNAYRMEHKI